MAYSLSPWLKPRFFITGTNRPLAGGLMYTYKAGTTDNATTYSDDAGTPNTNPIVLDSDGQCDLFLDDAVSYRIILKNSAGVTQFDKDRIASLGSTQVQSFNSIAALRLRSGTTIANAAKTLGYYSAGDGGGNSFYWDSTSTATDNSATIIKPTAVSGAGRWLAIDTSSVSVLQFGADSTGNTEATAIFTAALAASNEIILPSGIYKIKSVSVAANKKITTIGAVTIQQLSGVVTDARTFVIAGSNVSIGDMTIVGNISTDTGEQRHGFFMQPSTSIKNITIGNITGKNIRGDIIYIGGTPTNKITNVNIGNITIDNVYRNGVAVTGGENITIDSLTCISGCGYGLIDVEPNIATSQTCDNIRIKYAKGRTILINGQNSDVIGKVIIDFADLNKDYQTNSTPAYAPYDAVRYGGISAFNFNLLQIGTLKTNNMDYHGIRCPSLGGYYAKSKIRIDRLEQSNCSLIDPTYNSYNLASSSYVIEFTVKSAEITLHDPATKKGFESTVLDISNVVINGQLCLNCTKPKISNMTFTCANDIYVIGASPPNSTHAATITDSSVVFTGAVGRLTNVPNCTIVNSNIVYGNFFTTSGNNIVLINSYVNTVLYVLGNYTRDYTTATRQGSSHLWTDATGDLRIKSSAPTTDLDGTVVGTQT
jgi:hypothetical protein